MGQKFFDMQESSRLNMSFNCSGAFNIIYIMRTTTSGRRRKRLHRINATPFLTWCPCGDVAFTQNGLQRVSVRYRDLRIFMMSGHPLKLCRYVKIFTYQTHSQAIDIGERHPLETLTRNFSVNCLQFVTQPVKNAKNYTRFNGRMRTTSQLRLPFITQPDDRHKKAQHLARLSI